MKKNPSIVGFPPNMFIQTLTAVEIEVAFDFCIVLDGKQIQGV